MKKEEFRALILLLKKVNNDDPDISIAKGRYKFPSKLKDIWSKIKYYNDGN